VRPITEILTFTSIGALVPNRGQGVDAIISGLLYERA